MDEVAQHDTAEQDVSIDNLIQRFENLLHEIRQYQNRLVELGREDRVKWGGFDKTIVSDLNSVRKFAESRREGSPKAQVLRSSNIPYHEATWAAAKRSKGLVAFRESFSWRKPPKRWKKSIGSGQYQGRDHAVIVDVVADEGLQWIKVSSLTQRRLQFDLAKEGWAASDSDSSGARDDDDDQSEDESEIPILRTTTGLAKAAKAARVRYQHPKVKIVLPRFSSNSPDTDRIFDKIRAKGCVLELGGDCSIESSRLEHALQDLDEIDDHADLTSTVNIDCTVLLSLVSDISHLKKCDEPWLHPHVKAQVELEQEDQLLAANLYPALANRELVCTKEAAEQMKTIVHTVGNSTELKRTELLLMWDESLDVQAKEVIRAEFASLSEHPLPSSIRLPIFVVNEHSSQTVAQGVEGFSQRICNAVSEKIRAVNASVFMYGWQTGYTTITSNRSAVHQIEDLIEANRDPDEADENVRGPVAWFIPVARSLVGMDRGRKFLGQDGRPKSEGARTKIQAAG